MIYYVYDEENPIYLLACYGKNETDDLTESQQKTMRAFAQAIKAAARERKRK